MPAAVRLPTDRQEITCFSPYSKQPSPSTRYSYSTPPSPPDTLHQTPSPTSTPTTPTTPSLDHSAIDTSFSSAPSASASVGPLKEQQIAEQILWESSQTEGGRLRIPNIDSASYHRITTLVSNSAPTCLCYFYDVKASTIVVDRLASAIHESLGTALARLQRHLQGWLATKFGLKAEVLLVGQQKYNLFENWEDAIRGKCPDQGYKIAVSGRVSDEDAVDEESPDEDFQPHERWRFYPTIIVEIGFSESYDDLIEDAKLWLLKTPHHPVLSFILFKFQKPETSEPGDVMDFENWGLFFEVWRR